MESVAESECVGESLERADEVPREKGLEWRKGMEIANLEQKKKARYRRPDQDMLAWPLGKLRKASSNLALSD